MSRFIARICGTPFNISLILNAVDVVNANEIYPRFCLDGYHFEDVTVAVNVDEENKLTLVSAIPSNVRGSL